MKKLSLTTSKGHSIKWFLGWLSGISSVVALSILFGYAAVHNTIPAKASADSGAVVQPGNSAELVAPLNASGDLKATTGLVVPAESAAAVPASGFPMPQDPRVGRGSNAEISHAMQLPQSQSVNSVEIAVTSVSRDSEYVYVGICYQLPSQEDWLPGNSPNDVWLTIGNQTVFVWGIRFVEWKTSSDGTKTHRCDKLSFPVPPTQAMTQFSIIINRLVTSVPEKPDCNKAQGKLDKVQSGITIQCSSAPGSFGFTIATKPSGMATTQAGIIVQDAFSDIVQGPWVFASGLK